MTKYTIVLILCFSLFSCAQVNKYDKGREVLPNEGIGELKIGMSKSEIVKILGEPEHYKKGEYKFFEEYLTYWSKGIVINLRDKRVRGIFAYCGCVNRSQNYARANVFIKDVNVFNLTLSEAKVIYGEPYHNISHSYAFESGIRLDFSQTTERVTVVGIYKRVK